MRIGSGKHDPHQEVGLKEIFVSLFCLFASLHARAQTTEQLGQCSQDGIELGIFLEEGQTLGEGSELSVVSSQKAADTGLNLMTSGVLRQRAGKIELAASWKPSTIDFSNCRFVRPVSSPILRDYYMYVQTYFISAASYPPKDLDDLIRRGEAIPLKIHLICRSDAATAPSPVACRKIVIHEQIIPVRPSINRNRLRPIASRAAALKTSDSAVEIESAICGQALSSKASGVVIQGIASPVVVTSANAVLSENGQNSCTTATWNGQNFKLQLLRQDWGTGVAILSFVGSRVPVPQALLAATPGLSTPYPDSLLIGHASRAVSTSVLVQESDRHFIPRVAKVAELLGDEIDPSFVGAPVTDDGGSVFGIIAHQYLDLFPGSITRPLRWSPNGPGTIVGGKKTDKPLMISSQTIADVISRTAIDPAPFWVQPDRRTGFRVHFGKLELVEKCPDFSSSNPADGYPIGGVDPVGVGGDSSNYRACQIEVSLLPVAAGPVSSVWHDDLVAKLAEGRRIEIPFGIKRNSSGGWDRGYYYSLESFLKMADTLAPLALVYEKNASVAGLEPKLIQFRRTGAELAVLSKKAYVNFRTSDSQSNRMIRELYYLAVLAQSESWKNIGAKDLETVLDRSASGHYRNVWTTLFGLYPFAPELYQKLQDFQSEWRLIK